MDPSEHERLELDRIATLVERLRHDDQSAIGEFIRQYSPRFAKLLSDRGFVQVDAWDLAPECATQVLVKLERFTGSPQEFNSWCFAVARNYAEDQRRKKRKVVFEEFEENMVVAWPDELLERAQDADHDFPPNELTLLVREIVGKLPKTHRRIIEMRHLNGTASFRDIALELGIGEGAARVRHLRAIRKLEEVLRLDPRVVRFIEGGM